MEVSVSFLFAAVAIGILVGWLISEQGHDRRLVSARRTIACDQEIIAGLNEELSLHHEVLTQLLREANDTYVMVVAELGVSEPDDSLLFSGR